MRKEDGSYFEATFHNGTTRGIGKRFSPQAAGGWVKAELVDFKPHGKGLMRHKAPNGKFLLFKVEMDNGRYAKNPEPIGEDPDQSMMRIPSIE